MSRFIEEEFQIPVCIADLPAHDFQVSLETLTEDVVAVLEDTPDLPGVLIVNNRKLVGFITRLKLFERLGHRYGIELFMRKPIRELNNIMRTQVEPLSGNMRVEEAVQRALNRPPLDIYDPVVVEVSNSLYRILDMNVLVLAQSRTVINLSNVFGKLERLDALVLQKQDKTEIAGRILRLLGQVVPYHQAQVLIKQSETIQLVASYGWQATHPLDLSSIQTNPIYQMMRKHRQAIYLPDTSHVPAWKGMDVLGQPASWLGVPLLDGEGDFFGFLSLGRNVDSPFTSNEKQTCEAFAQRMANVWRRKEKKKGIIGGNDSFTRLGGASPIFMEMLTWNEIEGVY
ncbi:MAG: hypothetical protein Fur0016_13580 [Anaerolineales bacterium]